MKRAERLYALTELLRRAGRRGCTAERMASEFDVSVRTIKRDLASLSDAGVPVWSRPGPGGGHGLSERATLAPINLTPQQAVALMVAASAARQAPYGDAARAGVAKILTVMDPVARADAERLAARIWVEGIPSASRTVRSSVEEAMARQVAVRITYVDAHGVSTRREVEPVMFASTGGHWFLVGWCRLRGAMRWFRWERIVRAAVTTSEVHGYTVADVGAPPAGARSVGDHEPGAVGECAGRTEVA